MESVEGRRLHGLEEQARERGEFLEALELSDQAMVAYSKDSDNLGFAEIQAARFLILRHLFEKTEETLGEIPEAAETYKQALENITNNPPQAHNRASVIADFKIHLSACEYKNGDKSALERLEQAISELEAVPVISDDQYEQKNKQLSFNEEVPSNKAVWLSGGYMEVAEILKADNPEKAKQALNKAKEITDSDERLTLRKGQWEKLAATFS